MVYKLSLCREVAGTSMVTHPQGKVMVKSVAYPKITLSLSEKSKQWPTKKAFVEE